MNKYIEYIKNMKQDKSVDTEMYNDLIKGFKLKLETWLFEKPRHSLDKDFIEITEGIQYISKELNIA